jgi:hypothetical protein
MNRDEALALLGQSVYAFTAANGEYVGILTEVLPTRPWRAMVQITHVLQPANYEYGKGDRQRTGFEVGNTIEVGNTSVCAQRAPANPRSYLDALRMSAARDRNLLQTAVGGPNEGALRWILVQTEKDIALRERLAELPRAAVRDLLRIGTKQRKDEVPGSALMEADLAIASPWGPKLTSTGWRAFAILSKQHPAEEEIARRQAQADTPVRPPRMGGIFGLPDAEPAPQTRPAPPARPVASPSGMDLLSLMARVRKQR